MKNTSKVSTYLFLIAFVTAPLWAQAQLDDSRFGVKGGVNFTNFYTGDVGDRNVKTGFNLGLFAELAVGDQFSIQPEVLLTTKGNKTDYSGFLGIDQEVKFGLTYIEIPVLAKITLGEIINLHVGPYAGYLIGANVSTDGDLGEEYEDLDRDNFKTWDYGLAAGLGVDIDLVTIGARYNLGLARVGEGGVWDNILEDNRNSVAQIYLAIGL